MRKAGISDLADVKKWMEMCAVKIEPKPVTENSA
jgi:hypothetical protein